MTTPDEALRTLERGRDDGTLAALCDDANVDLLVVHGSVLDPARARPPEDLDLAVLFARGSDGDVITLLNALTRMLRTDAVDVMVLNRAGVVARAEALGHGVPFFERRDGLFAQQQVAALTERMETAWMRRLDLDLLAR